MQIAPEVSLESCKVLTGFNALGLTDKEIEEKITTLVKQTL